MLNWLRIQHDNVDSGSSCVSGCAHPLETNDVGMLQLAVHQKLALDVPIDLQQHQVYIPKAVTAT